MVNHQCSKQVKFLSQKKNKVLVHFNWLNIQKVLNIFYKQKKEEQFVSLCEKV